MTSSPAVRPIVATSVSERVTIELRRAILSGRLAPGERFSLRKIAEMLQVSFIPVREALRSLESEGLVITQPGHSARVAPLDLDELRGIYRLRRQLEPEIARRACPEIDDDELDRLEAMAGRFGASGRSADEIDEDHLAFHHALLAPAATKWDLRILATLWRGAERYVRIAFGRLDPDPSEPDRRESTHEALIAAFRTRDPDTVEDAVHAHLAHDERIALRALGEAPIAPRDASRRAGRGAEG